MGRYLDLMCLYVCTNACQSVYRILFGVCVLGCRCLSWVAGVFKEWKCAYRICRLQEFAVVVVNFEYFSVGALKKRSTHLVSSDVARSNMFQAHTYMHM